MIRSMSAAERVYTKAGEVRTEVIDGGKNHGASEDGKDLFENMDGIADRGFRQIRQKDGLIRSLGSLPRDSSQAAYLNIASKFLQQSHQRK